MTQILPPDDLFAAGAPAYGGVGTGFLPLYLQGRPTTGAINTIWLPTGFGIGFRPLHSGYQAVNPLSGLKDYNAAFYNNGSGGVGAANSRQPSGVTFRVPFAADVVVQGVFEMRSIAGVAGLAELAPRGVFARYQNGTLSSDGTATPEISGGDCYLAALYQKQSDSSLRLGIIRFVAGAPTVLAESVAVPSSIVNFAALFTITLTISGTALFATATSTGGAGVIRVPASGTITDSGVVGGGRCGFIMGADREPSAGRRQVDLCHMFRVEESGVVKLQDEFLRLSLAAAKQTPADIAGVVGNYLNSAFYWDAGTYDGSFSASGKTYTGGRKLLRHATAGRVQFNHATTDDDVNSGRLLLSQRLADSQFSQHRSVKVNIPSAAAAATGEVWAGIVLRAKQAQPLDENPPTVPLAGGGPNFSGNGSANTAASGYLFVIRARGLPVVQVTWQIHRLSNGSHFPVAFLTENPPFPGSNVFQGYGTQHELDFEVFPRNAGDPYGPVEMRVKVNGVAIALALTTPATNAGILNPSAGIFVDGTSGRIKSGLGEGLAVANGFFRSGTDAANIDPDFESWVQETLTNVSVLDEDQASVTLLTEGAAVGVALDTILSPSELPITYEGWSISNPFESGHRQSAPRFLNQADGSLHRRQTMRFFKRGAREAELVALLAHFDAHSGVELPFLFTPPGGTALKVAYKSDAIEHEFLEPDAYEIRFELELRV